MPRNGCTFIYLNHISSIPTIIELQYCNLQHTIIMQVHRWKVSIAYLLCMRDVDMLFNDKYVEKNLPFHIFLQKAYKSTFLVRFHRPQRSSLVAWLWEKCKPCKNTWVTFLSCLSCISVTKKCYQIGFFIQRLIEKLFLQLHQLQSLLSEDIFGFIPWISTTTMQPRKSPGADVQD